MPILNTQKLAQLASAVLVISTAACVAGTDGGRPSDDQADWRSGGKADGQSCDPNMPASAYYGQFDYTTRTSDNSTSTWYRVGLTWSVKAHLDNGDDATLRGYFLPDHRVIVEYSEEHRTSASESDVLNQTVLVTRAHIDAATRAITIDGVGTGTPLQVTNSDGTCAAGVALTYSTDIRSAGLKGDATQLLAGWTSAYVIDPDHLDQVQNETARRYFEEDVASGKIKVVHVP